MEVINRLVRITWLYIHNYAWYNFSIQAAYSENNQNLSLNTILLEGYDYNLQLWWSQGPFVTMKCRWRLYACTIMILVWRRNKYKSLVVFMEFPASDNYNFGMVTITTCLLFWKSSHFKISWIGLNISLC